MASWLKKDLENNKLNWLIVLFHHPPYTKGSHDSDVEKDSGGRMKEMRENILPILEKYNTDLVLCGHSHVYERTHLIKGHYGESGSFNPSNIIQTYTVDSKEGETTYIKSNGQTGTIYIVCGVGCHRSNIGSLDHPAMAYSSAKHNGSMSIEIKNNRLLGVFINDNGKVKDSFTIVKE